MSVSGRAGRVGRVGRTLLRLAFVASLVGAGLVVLDWAKSGGMMPGGAAPWTYYVLLGLALVLYAVMLALPFVPGIELGLMILAMQGPAAALPVYLATLAGLALAFAAGRWMQAGWIAAALSDAGLARAAGFVARAEGLTPEERLALLRARLPDWLGLLAGGRYLVLVVLVNLPGNGLLGGGGGIMLLAGLSRLFRPLPTMLTIALAVAPVPLLVWSLGIEVL